ncbi:hypothetical protein PoB_003585200 [Plakobranchus ocellatus]|uniref:Uncharacterized protein n=1 Tax=Plakobranchus ocellatus TaxID=259542 RepID=A0AAV4AQY7_9GAST|nr:hypothetical protein PoB_003585200 [Plakobranchus ocellatus]
MSLSHCNVSQHATRNTQAEEQEGLRHLCPSSRLTITALNCKKMEMLKTVFAVCLSVTLLAACISAYPSIDDDLIDSYSDKMTQSRSDALFSQPFKRNSNGNVVQCNCRTMSRAVCHRCKSLQHFQRQQNQQVHDA